MHDRKLFQQSIHVQNKYLDKKGDICLFLDWKSSRHNIFSPLRQNLNGTVGEEFGLGK